VDEHLVTDVYFALVHDPNPTVSRVVIFSSDRPLPAFIAHQSAAHDPQNVPEKQSKTDGMSPIRIDDDIYLPAHPRTK
jgi:hypothetical protein